MFHKVSQNLSFCSEFALYTIKLPPTDHIYILDSQFLSVSQQSRIDSLLDDDGDYDKLCSILL